jgi:hypothetical protein
MNINHSSRLVNRFKKSGNQVITTTTVKQTSAPIPAVAPITVPKETPANIPTPSGIDKSEDVQPKVDNVQTVEILKGLGKGKVLERTVKQWTPQVPLSKAIPYFVQSQGYYLAFDSGRVLFQVCDNGKATQKGVLPTILKKPTEGGGSGVHSIKASYNPQVDRSKTVFQRSQGTNLTQADMDSIIKGKPSIQQLLDVYDRYSQTEIDIDISKSIPVW